MASITVYSKSNLDTALAGKVGVDDTGRIDAGIIPDLSATYASSADLTNKVDKGSLALNVKDYGATGNGQTDDTAAIQSALAASGSSGIPASLNGTHLIKGQLKPPTGSALDGSRGSLTVDASSTLRAILVQNASNVVLSNIVIDMNSALTVDGGTASNQQGVYVNASTAVSNIVVRNVTVQNSHYRGVDVAESAGGSISNVRICDCTVSAVGDRAVSVTQAAGVGVWITGLRATSPGLQGITVPMGNKVVIRDCIVTDPGDHGIVLGGLTAGTVTSASVSDCHIAGAAKYGIAVSMSVTDWSVAGCHATGCALGGMTVDAERTNNLGVIQSAPGTVSGCTFESSAQRGLQIRMASDVVVTGNIMKGNTLQGVYLATSTGATITGNNITGNATGIDFVEASASGGHYIAGNRVVGNTANLGAYGLTDSSQIDFQTVAA